jgi:hypothetical protein
MVMKRLTRAATAVLIGVGLSIGVAAAASAQEVPTGAARIIEKVQTRIFISKANLTFHVAAILENQPSPGE